MYFFPPCRSRTTDVWHPNMKPHGCLAKIPRSIASFPGYPVKWTLLIDPWSFIEWKLWKKMSSFQVFWQNLHIYICFMGLDYSFTRFIIKEKIMKIEVPSDPSKISPFFVLFFQASATQAEVGKGATIWQADHASLEVDMSVKKLRFALTSEPWQRDVFRWFAVWMKNFPVISGLW